MPAAGRAFCFTWHTAFCPAMPSLTISSPLGWVMHTHPHSDQALQPCQPAPPPGEMGIISFSPLSSSFASEVTLDDLVACLGFKISCPIFYAFFTSTVLTWYTELHYGVWHWVPKEEWLGCVRSLWDCWAPRLVGTWLSVTWSLHQFAAN